MFHAPTRYQVTNYVLPKHPKISGFSESFESQAIPATGDTKLDILEIAKHLNWILQEYILQGFLKGFKRILLKSQKDFVS